MSKSFEIGRCPLCQRENRELVVFTQKDGMGQTMSEIRYCVDREDCEEEQHRKWRADVIAS